MIPYSVYIIGTSSVIFILLSVYTRYTKSNRLFNLSDPFYLCIGFFFLYYVIGQFGRLSGQWTYGWDSFDDRVFILVAFLVLASTILLYLLTKFSTLKLGLLTIDEDLTSEYLKFLTAAIICLLVGYIFWYFNYARLGDINSIFHDFGYRSYRNNRLSQMLGNLPYTHFLYIGYSFTLSLLLLKGKSVIKSIAISFITVSPLILFYILEGERTGILKYVISSFFIISMIKNKGIIPLRKKYALSLVLLFLLFSIIGGFRASISAAISNGDIAPIVLRVNDYGYKAIIPSEFKNVNFTLNKTVHDITEGKHNLQFGKSYIQSIPYLFPRSVYKIFGLTKEPTIADEFGERISLEYKLLETLENDDDEKDNIFTGKVSFGMSAMAEAIANFHFAGAILLPIMLFSFISLWNKIVNSSNKVYNLILMAMLTPMFLVIHRTSFASIFSFVAYISFISFIAYWLGSVLEKVLSIIYNK